MDLHKKVKDLCWSNKGIWGDSSCEELGGHVHCFKCPVYGEAGRKLFDREIPVDYIDEWANAIANAHEDTMSKNASLFVFKCGGQPFAIDMNHISELAPMRMIHKLPHRRDAIVRGLANINGELILTIDILKLFGISSELFSDEYIVVCKNGDEKFAFTASSLKGLATVEEASLILADDGESWYISKKFELDGEKVILINFEIFASAITKKKI